MNYPRTKDPWIVHDNDTKTIQCINFTSYYLVSIKVGLYFIN